MRLFFALLFMVVGPAFGQLGDGGWFTGIRDSLQEGDPAVLELPPQWVDTTLRFGETNVTDIRDIELFADGRIAFGGRGSFESVGIAAEDGSVLEPSFGGMLLAPTRSVAADDVDGVVYGGGVPIGTPPNPVTRMVNGRADFFWHFREDLQGNAAKVLLQADRKLIAAGELRRRSETNQVYGLVRLDLTGALDPSFDPSGAAGLEVHAAALLRDGRILAGYAHAGEANTRYGVGRWFAHGPRDEDYRRFDLWATGTWTNSHVTVIEKAPGTNGFAAAVQNEPLGVGGPKFTRIFLLDEDGLVTGELGRYVHGAVNAIAFEAVSAEALTNGGYDRVIIGGDFTQAVDMPCNKVAAISRDGTVAWCFGAGEGPSGPVQAVAVQPDGKVLIGGAFTNVNGFEVRGMARLLGSSQAGATRLWWADSEFRGFEKLGEVELVMRRAGDTNQSLSVDFRVRQEHPVPPGRPPVWPEDLGKLERVVFAPGEDEARVKMGVRNDAFTEGREVFEFTASVTNSNVLITRARTDLVILDDETPGTLDPVKFFERQVELHNFAVQPDGKIVLVRGGTTLLRLHPDGTVDETFVTNGIPALPGSWQIHEIEPQPGGKIYVGGKFNTTNGFGINHLARLNVDGTLDTNFNPRLFRSGNSPSSVQRLVFDVAPDGRVVIWTPDANFFTRPEGGTTFQQTMWRLDGAGAMDRGFSGNLMMRDVAELKHLPNGELVAYSDRINLAAAGIVKLRTNGVPQANFMVRVPLSRGFVYDLEPAGNWLYFGGSFKEVNSLAVSNLARVNLASGALDPNFAPVLNAEVRDLAARGEKIYAAGEFTKVNGRDRFRVARMDLDGSLDGVFDPGFGPNAGPGRIDLDNDGRLFIGSNFDQVDGVATAGLVRLEGNTPFSAERFAPVVEILWPTNGTDIRMTDAWYDLEIRGRASDADGDLGHVVVELDGTPVSTNVAAGESSLREFVVRVPMPSFAEHELKVTAWDTTGLSGSETVMFQVTNHARSEPVVVRKTGGEVVIQYTNGKLQASTDLRTWRDVHTGGGEFRPGNLERYQFFRAANP
jgi:uncharacterized delta-60 repeat protein